MLPDNLFEPLIDKRRAETDRLALLDVGYQNYKNTNFLKLFNKMSKLIHFAIPKRLGMLQALNKNLISYEKVSFIIVNFKCPVDLKDFIKSNDNKYQDRLRELKS